MGWRGQFSASEIRASATLAPGATVTGTIGTLHSEEIAGNKNGLGTDFSSVVSLSELNPAG
jgi:hypothetical protein